MATKVLHNLLSEDDIRFLLDNPDVISSKGKLSSQSKVDVSIHLPDSLKKKLEVGLNISLTDRVPLRWIKGNTTAHTDKGQSHFNRTHIVYLTNSAGNLVIDNQTYTMNAGDGYVFNEGLVHYTTNSEHSERLMIGPMSESGFGVGGTIVPITLLNTGPSQLYSGTPNDGPTKSFVLSCIDPRFAHATDQYLYDKYTSNGLSYDHFVLAGAALGGRLTGPGTGSGQCNVLSANSNWNQTLKDHVQIAITLHNVKGVEILDHLNCGAYGSCISGITTGSTGDQGVTYHEAQYNVLSSNISGSTFVTHNGIDGTTLGSVIFSNGVTGGYFDGYTNSVTTTLIDYSGNSIRTEAKGTYSGAKVLVLGCIDPRYASILSSFLREYKGVQFIYDLFILAGASIGANQSYLANGNVRTGGSRGDYPNNVLADGAAGIGNLGRTWGPAFFDHLELAIELHGITEVWVFDHLDCGAYKAIHYGDLSVPDLDVKPHIAEMQKLRKSINTAGPRLGFQGFIIDQEGTITKYIENTTLLGDPLFQTTNPNTFTGDASDFTRNLKQRRLFKEFQGTRSDQGSITPYNNPFNRPVDYRIVQSNQNRLSYNFGAIVCGCTGAFPNIPLGEV
jgi:carbonic anhydrase